MTKNFIAFSLQEKGLHCKRDVKENKDQTFAKIDLNWLKKVIS